MTNTLYCFAESGNAYKAALALELAGIPWEARFVDFFNGEARGAAFRKINPMGEVPVLDADGLILTQSGVIQDWVMETTGKLGGTSPADRREVLRWTIFDNQKVSGMAGPLRFFMNYCR
jgi:Glutathione S-transferase